MSLAQELRQVARQRRLLGYILSGFCSNIGTWAQRLAVGWLVFKLTGSVAWVGIVAACEVIPSIFVQPFGGVLIDRYQRAKVLALGNLAAFLQALTLVVLYLAGLLDIWVILACSIFLGLLEGVNQPARLTMVAEFVERRYLRIGISLNSLSFNLARFVGPLVASLFLTTGHVTLAFAFNAASFVPMILLLLFVRLAPQDRSAQPVEGFARAFLSGLRYVKGHPLVHDLLILALVVNLCCRSLIELLPAITGLRHGNDPVMLSLLTSSVAVGAMLGGVLILTRSGIGPVLRAVGLLSGLTCLAAMGMAAAGGLILPAALAAFCLGLGASGAAVGMQNVIHDAVEPAYLGRAMALYGLVQRGAAVLGAVVIGALADLLGLQAPVLAASALAIALVLRFQGRVRGCAETLSDKAVGSGPDVK